MIDWLTHDPRHVPTVPVGGRELPVVVRRLAIARRMTLRLAPDGSEVRVSMPRWGRTAEAIAFARARLDWLEEQAALAPRSEPPRCGSQIAYRGALFTIAHDPAAPRRITLRGQTLHVGGPADALATRIRRWLENRAREILAADLEEYCARAGLAPPRFALTSARRRWGSCSASGTVRINWRLIMAPDSVRRSVVAHEVAHLIHFDHSPRFHVVLAEIYEADIAEANRWLRLNGRQLAAPFG